ncbi:MAG TPA: Fe-S protein assembly co-chaperone HscB [Rhodocyclaceae bacterium]|nr:Fe-S protein assembly co-chaperone HscB [Rhodocyclaceae bacterium]
MTRADYDLAKDYFALLDLPRRQHLDREDLERRYHEVQAQVHPDKHAHLSDQQKRLAMQWATRANEAYLTLKSPLKRAHYLLQLAGHDPQIERNTAMPMEFLVQQMEWREAVEEGRGAGDAEELDALHRRLRKEMSGQYAELERVLDVAPDLARAADVVRQLMFQEKLLHEIDEALAAVEN